MARRFHETAAFQRNSGIGEEVFDFRVNDRVMTVDGFPGQVVARSSGPWASTEDYEVVLDGGMGGGTYTAAQLKKINPNTAALHEAAEFTASIPIEAVTTHTADVDYPELGTILYDRLPNENVKLAANKDNKATVPQSSQEDPGERMDQQEEDEEPDQDENNTDTKAAEEPADEAGKEDDDAGPPDIEQEKVNNTPDVTPPSACSFCGADAFEDPQMTGRGVRMRCSQCGGTMKSWGGQWEPEFPNSSENNASGQSDWSQGGAAGVANAPGANFKTTKLDVEAGIINWVVDKIYDRIEERKNHEILGKEWAWQTGMEGLPNYHTNYADYDCPTCHGVHPSSLHPDGLTIHGSLTDDYDAEWKFHFTASWQDVQAKAKRIRKEGGVKILVASNMGVAGEVKGDHSVYETQLNYVLGTKHVADWACGCKWASYTWGRSPAYRRFEGRLCSHALALQYEANARGMFGKDVATDSDRPTWQKAHQPVQVQYERPSDRHPEGRDLRRRAVPPGNMRRTFSSLDSDGIYENPELLDLSHAPVYASVLSMMDNGEETSNIIEMMASHNVSRDRAKEMIFEALKADEDGINRDGDEYETPDGDRFNHGTPHDQDQWDDPEFVRANQRDLSDHDDDGHDHKKHRTNDSREHAPHWGWGLPAGAPIETCGQCNGSGCGACAGQGQIVSTPNPNLTAASPDQTSDAGDVVSGLSTNGSAKIHFSHNDGPACGAGSRWDSREISSTKGTKKVNCASCLKSKAYNEALNKTSSSEACGCSGARKIEPHRADDHPEWADKMHAAGKTDAWGQPIMQPYDGHGAWGCNNYHCAEHPQEMYEQQPGRAPGWLLHDTDPNRALTREVNKSFHDSGSQEDGRYLLDQNHTGPSKYSKIAIDNSHRYTDATPSGMWPKIDRNKPQTFRDHLKQDHGYNEDELKSILDRHWQRARDGEVSVPKGTDHLHGVVDFLEKPFKDEHEHVHGGNSHQFEADGHKHPHLKNLEEVRFDSYRKSSPADPVRGGGLDPQNPNWGDFRRLRGTHPDLPNLRTHDDPHDNSNWSNLSGCKRTYDIHDDDQGDVMHAANEASDARSSGKISNEQFEHLGFTCPDCGAYKHLHAQPYKFDTDRLVQSAPMKPLPQSMNTLHTADYSSNDPLAGVDDQNYYSPTNHSNSRNPASTGWATSQDPGDWGQSVITNNFGLTTDSALRDEADDEIDELLPQYRKLIDHPDYHDRGSKGYRLRKELAPITLRLRELQKQKYERQNPPKESALASEPTVAGVLLRASDTGRLLMLQRALAEGDKNGGLWEMPGGHLEEGEKPLHGAVREFEEETGHPFPQDAFVVHTWRSGPYRGHLVEVPSESHLDFGQGRQIDNPDGDVHENVAWWDPEHAKKNPALRPEMKGAPWEQFKKAAGGDKWVDTQFGDGGSSHEHRFAEPSRLGACGTCGRPLFDHEREDGHCEDCLTAREAPDYSGGHAQHVDRDTGQKFNDHQFGGEWNSDSHALHYLHTNSALEATLVDDPDEVGALPYTTGDGGGNVFAGQTGGSSGDSSLPQASHDALTGGSGDHMTDALHEAKLAFWDSPAAEKMMQELGITKAAMKDFSFSEQQDLINEGQGSRARNFGDLKIAGTHYEHLDDDDDGDLFI